MSAAGLWAGLLVAAVLTAGCAQVNPEALAPVSPADGVAELGDPVAELPFAQVLAAHGSAVVNVTGAAGWLEVQYRSPGTPARIAAGNVSEDGVLLPFLDPATAYAYEWRLESMNGTAWVGDGVFRTVPSPFQWADWGEARIHPGIAVGGCTLGFIFRDATNDTLWAMTAGHCYREGDTAYTHDNSSMIWMSPPGEGTLLGVVRHALVAPSGDFAFIEVDPEARHLVSPQVAHWTGPSGLATPEDVRTGDRVCSYGTGNLFTEHEATRPRCGTSWGYRGPSDSGATRFWQSGFANHGDSGSPVLHYDTGKAHGIVTHSLYGVWVEGTTVCRALEWLWEERGVQLQLATARYSPQPVLLDHPVPTVPSVEGVRACPPATWHPG